MNRSTRMGIVGALIASGAGLGCQGQGYEGNTESGSDLTLNIPPPIVACLLRPTLASCESHAWYATTCGQQEASAGYPSCGPLLTTAEQSMAAHTAFSPSGLVVNGLAASYTGALQHDMNAALGNGQLQLSKSFLYGLNGNAAASCEEYVYEKYQDWSAFHEAAAGHEANPLEIIDLAAQTTSPGINRSPLRRRDGTALVGHPSAGFEFKNEYVRLFTSTPLYPTKTTPFAWDPKLVAKITPLRANLVEKDAAFLATRDRAKTMNDYAYWQRKQKVFTDLVTQRATIFPIIENPPCTPTRCPPPLYLSQAEKDTYAAALRAQDQKIQDALREADAAGCFASGTTVCDFDPRRASTALLGWAPSNAEKDYQLCTRTTANDFTSANSYVLHALGKGVPSATKDNYTSGTNDIDSFIGLMQSWLSTAQKAKTTDTNGNPAIGTKGGDSTPYLGTADYNVSFNYDGSAYVHWPQSDTCHAQFTGTVNVGADGTFKGNFHHLFKAGLTLETGKDKNGNPADSFAITPKLVIGDDNEISATFDFPPAISDTKELIDPPFDIRTPPFTLQWFIGPVPVVVSAGFEVKAGLRAKYGVQLLSRNCQADQLRLLSLNGTLEPYGTASGYGSIAVGVADVVGVGIQVDLLFADLGLPLNATINVDARVPNPNDPSTWGLKLDGDFGMSARVHALDGSIFGTAAVLGFSKDVEFFSWSGPSVQAQLFDVPYTISLVN